MIFISKYIVPKGFTGITLFPFLILKLNGLLINNAIINHERTLLRQQIELLVIPFYLIHGFEFLIRLVQYKNWSLVYKNISFEREAYQNEKVLNYNNQGPFGK